MSLSAARALLQHHFGYQDFRIGQRRIVHAVLAGHDVLAVLPTGAGKSICFQIPALVIPGVALVVSPLISLMQDQVEAARRRGIGAALVNSTLDTEQQREVLDGAAGGRWRLLYVSPERLPRLVREFAALGVRPGLLAVDEAHCISEWGHDFRPAYRAIRVARAALGWPATLALTGSATPEVRADIRTSLGLGRASGKQAARRLTEHVGSFDRPNLWFGVRPVADDRARVTVALGLLKAEDGTAIVYTSTRNISEALSRLFQYSGIRSEPYHAGLTKERRAETLRRFLAGDLRVVVATSAFGMGIDKPDVRLVLHWTLPPTPESYYQEAGRAGRDGKLSRCILLFRREDALIHRLQLGVTFPPERQVERAWRDGSFLRRMPTNVQASVERLRLEMGSADPDWSRVRKRKRQALARLQAVERYARTAECRRKTLIGWFGERLARCAGCDRCG